MFYAAELLVNDNFDITSSVINLVRYSRSRSFKVIEIGTNRKSVRDFLFVIHCNCAYLLSFTRYNDMLVENAFFAVLHTAVSFKALYGVPCVLGYNMRSRKLESIAGWLNGSAVERWSLTGEFSLSSVQPTADG